MERAAERRAIAWHNGQALAAEPEIALRALTQQHSTFTRQELARFVNRHTDGAEQFAPVLAKVEVAPELVRLGEDGRGRVRFTTRKMLDTEARMERAADGIAGRDGHRVLQAAGWRAVKAAERDGGTRSARVPSGDRLRRWSWARSSVRRCGMSRRGRTWR